MKSMPMSDIEELRLALGRLDSITECAVTCCEFFITPDLDLASVYLLRSGRLRRYASVGHWQILDGLAPDSGVIGATVTSGRPHLIDVATSDLYLTAAQSAVAEACIPIRSGGEVIGALNLESSSSIDATLFAEMEAVADLFGSRVEALGGLIDPRGWPLLADRARLLTQARTEAEAIETALAVATTLTGASSALFVMGSSAEGLSVSAAAGPATVALSGLSDAALAAVDGWVSGPQSSYTVGDPAAPGFTGHDSLRVEGIMSLVCVAVEDGDHRVGYLLVASDSTELPTQQAVEQLEVLAALVGGAIRNAHHVEALTALTRRDPLTGLGHGKAFDDRLRSLEAAEDRSTAVFSIDIDRFKKVNDTLGHEAGDNMLIAVARAMEQALRGDDSVFRVGGDEFAVVMTVDDEAQAEAIGHRLLIAVRGTGATVSIGGALARFGGRSHSEVFALADSALYEAKRHGRDALVMAPLAG